MFQLIKSCCISYVLHEYTSYLICCYDNDTSNSKILQFLFCFKLTQVRFYGIIYVFVGVTETYIMTRSWIRTKFILTFSTLSSGINAMSANTLQDILVNVLENASEFLKTLIAKLVGKFAMLQFFYFFFHIYK
jgi:hypothetical protein